MTTYVEVINGQAARLVLPHVTDEWQDFQTITDKTGLRFSTVVAYLGGLEQAGVVVKDGRNWKLA
jgi:DNA-binding IclR family transcriptional regulator